MYLSPTRFAYPIVYKSSFIRAYEIIMREIRKGEKKRDKYSTEEKGKRYEIMRNSEKRKE